MWASPCTFIDTATVSGGGSESATANNINSLGGSNTTNQTFTKTTE
ncbi:hypothetical protein ABZS68_35930 [Streptomyces sp. NPDC005571]